jgi:DNA excision repair protein ERCC-5
MPDSDLREYQREMALYAHESSPTTTQSLAVTPINRKARLKPFAQDLSESEGELLSIAIERSFDDSHLPPSKRTPTPNTTIVSTSSHRNEDIYAELTPPTRLETALTFAGTAHAHVRTSPTRPGPSSVFGKQNLLFSPRKERWSASSKPLSGSDVVTVDEFPSGLSTEAGIVSPLFGTPTLLSTPEKIMSSPTAIPFGEKETPPTATPRVASMLVREFLQPSSDSDEELEEVLVDVAPTAPILDSTVPDTFPEDPDESVVQTQDSHPSPLFVERSPSPKDPEDDVIEWSRTPSPVLDQPVSSAAHDQEWDAAHEMDARAEEGEFARFISQVKGKNIDDVRKEIDDEINDLNRQRRAAMRDSEDVTQQMITQIMVGFLSLHFPKVKDNCRQCCVFSGFLISLHLWKLKRNVLRSCR